MQKTKKKNFKREILIGLALLIAAGIIFFILMEVTVRVMDIDYSPMSDNDCVGWTFLPNSKATLKKPEFTTHTSINSEGFRDVNHKIESEGAYRVLLLGDSFVEASQVDFNNTYGQVLQSELQQISGRKVEVISMGIGGYSTDQEYLAMQCYGMKYKPDLVILSFLTLNDVSGNSKEIGGQGCKPYFILEANGSLSLDNSFRERCSSIGSSVKKWIGHRSRFVYFAVTNLQKISLAQKATTSTLPHDFEVYRVELTESYSNGWKITERVILEMESSAHKNGADFMVVVLTNPQQLSWQKTVERYPAMANGNYSPNAPEAPISNICEANNMDCLHLLPIFVQYKNLTGKDPHLAVDGHWNELGNWLAGRNVAEYVVSRNYLG